MKYYLGIDIGASSGRHMLAHKEDGKLVLEEIYRFENKLIRIHDHDCWDIEQLFEEVCNGIKHCVKKGIIPVSMSIDTWACDFVLLDEQGKRIDECVSYRDSRVDAVIEETSKVLNQKDLYKRTGIQFQKFNTLYQLLSVKKCKPHILEKAQHFLMVPDYLMYRLTDVITNEYTNASTTQLVNVHTQTWDKALMDIVGLPNQIFHPFTKPGLVINEFSKEIQNRVGCNMKVIECATHDTASAFASVKHKGEIILSSGTWSLLGTINEKPILSEEARDLNFTNEGSYDGTYRFLKNIMGLWIIQEVRHCLHDAYSFSDLVDMAYACKQEPMIIDVNDSCFLHPSNMIEEIQAWCARHQSRIPETPGEIALCVFHSLAFSYKKAINELEQITGKTYREIHIVGGGSNNQLLNELCAFYTGKKVVIGNKEATIIGNIQVQIEREEQNNECRSIWKS